MVRRADQRQLDPPGAVPIPDTVDLDTPRPPAHGELAAVEILKQLVGPNATTTTSPNVLAVINPRCPERHASRFCKSAASKIGRFWRKTGPDQGKFPVVRNL